MLDTRLLLPGLLATGGQGLDAGDQGRPPARVGQVVGPHVLPEEDAAAGGRLADSPVDRQLVRVVGCMEPLECPTEHRLGLRGQGECPLHPAPTPADAGQE